MSRPCKAVVDYFPHFVNHGKLMFAIESKYGNDGYAFYYKMEEVLGSSEQHFIDCEDVATWEYLLAITLVDENTALSILDTFSKLKAIDQELWKEKIIRSNDLIENLNSVYSRREISVISNEEVLSFCKRKSHLVGVTSNNNLQSKVKDRKAEENIKKKSTHKGEDIQGEENTADPKPKSNPGGNKKQLRKPEIQIQEKESAQNPAAEEKAKNQAPRILSPVRLSWAELVRSSPVNDRNTPVRSPVPKEPVLIEEEDFGFPETSSTEPSPENVNVQEREDEPATDFEDTVRSAEPKVTINPEPGLEPEPTESENINGEPELTQDPEEIKFPKRITIDDDW